MFVKIDLLLKPICENLRFKSAIICGKKGTWGKGDLGTWRLGDLGKVGLGDFGKMGLMLKKGLALTVALLLRPRRETPNPKR
jgi:hypothetical protein